MVQYQILNEEVIDPDLGVKIILRSDSPFWKIQFNLPGKGQQRHSLKTKSKKQAKLKAYKLAGQIATGDLINGTGKKWTIGEVAEARCQRLRDLGRSPFTIADFHRRVRQLAAFLPLGQAAEAQDGAGCDEGDPNTYEVRPRQRVAESRPGSGLRVSTQRRHADRGIQR